MFYCWMLWCCFFVLVGLLLHSPCIVFYIMCVFCLWSHLFVYLLMSVLCCVKEVVSKIISKKNHCLFLPHVVSEFYLLSDVLCFFSFWMWCLSTCRMISVSVVFAVCGLVGFEDSFSFFREFYLVMIRNWFSLVL